MTTPDKKIAPSKDANQKPMTPNTPENKKDTDPEFEQNTPHKAQPERAQR